MVITLRPGNAWVHAIGYHAIASHVVVDAALMAKVFGIKWGRNRAGDRDRDRHR